MCRWDCAGGSSFLVEKPPCPSNALLGEPWTGVIDLVPSGPDLHFDAGFGCHGPVLHTSGHLPALAQPCFEDLVRCQSAKAMGGGGPPSCLTTVHHWQNNQRHLGAPPRTSPSALVAPSAHPFTHLGDEVGLLNPSKSRIQDLYQASDGEHDQIVAYSSPSCQHLPIRNEYSTQELNWHLAPQNVMAKQATT